ncbi:hypothetical protein K502DRAFT_325097 [Neoconidiobolus thromboides FSU 785]|nr:hypothetical protein K502DRAFT_325097 [Neoconidiobolus thromboides FSU 785]
MARKNNSILIGRFQFSLPFRVNFKRFDWLLKNASFVLPFLSNWVLFVGFHFLW